MADPQTSLLEQRPWSGSPHLQRAPRKGSPLSCGFGTRCAPTLRGLVRRVAGNLRRLTRRHQTRWGSSADISRSSPHRGQGTVKPWLQARRHLWHLSNMPCRLILVGLQFWLLFRRRTAEAKEILVVTEGAEEHLQQGFHRVACQIGEEGCVRAAGHVMAGSRYAGTMNESSGTIDSIFALGRVQELGINLCCNLAAHFQ